jgi:hypothetical protein
VEVCLDKLDQPSIVMHLHITTFFHQLLCQAECSVTEIKRFVFCIVPIIILLGVTANAYGQTSYYSLLIGVNNGAGWAETQQSLSMMERIARQNDHHAVVLAGVYATRKNILDTLKSIGTQIKDVKDASFLLYFNGYGGLKDDPYDGDEESGYDNTIIVYDDAILDDEITDLLRKYFKHSLNIMVVDAYYPQASSYNFLLMDFRLSGDTNRCYYETVARNQMALGRVCPSGAVREISDDFSLIYAGSGALNINGQPATNNSLTRWLAWIYSDHRHNNRHRRISYRDLFCELNNKAIARGEALQYLEIGSSILLENYQKPFYPVKQ